MAEFNEKSYSDPVGVDPEDADDVFSEMIQAEGYECAYMGCDYPDRELSVLETANDLLAKIGYKLEGLRYAPGDEDHDLFYLRLVPTTDADIEPTPEPNPESWVAPKRKPKE